MSEIPVNDPAAADGSPADRTGSAPTPRLATPATEPSAESVQRERDAVGEGPDEGGLTPEDDAQ